MSRSPTADGFTYFEVLLASIILAGAVTCMGLALEQSASVTSNAPIVATADYLLQDGVAWVRSLPRVDRSGSAALGMEAGETAIADVDDVDDLAGVSEADPVDRNGTAFGADWNRTFTVESVSLTDPTITATAGSTPLLRIRIVVKYQKIEKATDTILVSRTP